MTRVMAWHSDYGKRGCVLRGIHWKVKISDRGLAFGDEQVSRVNSVRWWGKGLGMFGGKTSLIPRLELIVTSKGWTLLICMPKTTVATLSAMNSELKQTSQSKHV